MNDLGDRIKFVAKKLGISLRELSRRAGLKNETHLALIASRKYKTTNNELLDSVAKASGVNIQWLISGDGEMFSASKVENNSNTIEKETRYPNLVSVLANKDVIEGISEEAISVVKSRANKEGPQEMSEMDWLLELKKAHKALGSYIASSKIKTREIDPGEFD